MGSRRIHYIDWLRVSAVLLLLPFHSGRVFNSGELFYAKSPITSNAIGYFLALIDYWHMPLLFLLAGASTYLAMRKRSVREYLGERGLRLLVPLVFGVLVIVPPQGWYGARTNDGYRGSFIDYVAGGRAWDVSSLFGRGDYYGGLTPAHLWFIMFLLLISIAVVPLLLIDRTDRGKRLMDRIAEAFARPMWWPLVLLLILIGEALPEIGGKNIFLYAAYFTMGYLLIRSEQFAERAERLRWPLLLAGSTILIASTLVWRWADSLPDPSASRALYTYVEDFGVWMVLVSLIGVGRRYLDRPSPALSYLAVAGYPLYVLHQTVIVVVGFYLVRVLPAPALGWPALILLATAATFGLYELVRRVPPLRFALGMKSVRRASPEAELEGAGSGTGTSPATP